MPITTFRGEKNLGEISSKLFVRLTPKQKEKVEAALLKANPQLGEIGTLRAGTILHIPDLPELRSKTRRALESPDQQVLAQLREDLDAYDKHLATRSETAQTQVAATAALLKDKNLLRTIGNDAALKQLLGEIGKSNSERKQKLVDRQKTLHGALEQIQKELESL
jgi:hypothetical protein